MIKKNKFVTFCEEIGRYVEIIKECKHDYMIVRDRENKTFKVKKI